MSLPLLGMCLTHALLDALSCLVECMSSPLFRGGKNPSEGGGRDPTEGSLAGLSSLAGFVLVLKVLLVGAVSAPKPKDARPPLFTLAFLLGGSRAANPHGAACLGEEEDIMD